MMLIQWLSFAVCMIFLFAVLTAIYRGSLREGYALVWLGVTLVLIYLSLHPAALKLLARLTGIKTPAFAIIIAVICGILLILFQQSIVLSKHNEKIKKLTEELTLLRSKNDKEKR